MKRMQKNRKIFSLFIFFLLAGCVNVQVVGEAEEPLDVRATLDAMGHPGPESEPTAAGNALPAAAEEPQAEPTAIPTVYVPEGQLVYENFESIEVGKEWESKPGILYRKQDYGVQIENTTDKDYLLYAGLSGQPDGNISTFAQVVSDPITTSALMGCRLQFSENPDAESVKTTGYIAEFRFDGAARLLRRENGSDTVLVDWQRGVIEDAAEGFHQLYLLCDGPRILFMLAGEKSFDVEDTALKEGDFAIGVGKPDGAGSSVVWFDKYSVFEP